MKKDANLRQSEILFYVFACHLSLMIIITLCFYFSDSFRKDLIELIFSLTQNDLTGSFYIWILGTIFVVIGFPIVLIEITLGYLCKNAIYAVFLIMAFKETGLIITFYISKLFLK